MMWEISDDVGNMGSCGKYGMMWEIWDDVGNMG